MKGDWKLPALVGIMVTVITVTALIVIGTSGEGGC